jgi:hypothetical protein
MMKKLLNLAALKAYRPIRVNPADLERSAELIPVIRDVSGDRIIFAGRNVGYGFSLVRSVSPAGKPSRTKPIWLLVR